MALPCIPIIQEKVRAEFYMGDTLIAKTPFIKSFSVNESRSSITGGFNITFEIMAGTQFPLLANITLKAGLRGSLNTIFTGIIESTNFQPCFGKPSYFTVQLSGRGILSQLENKKFSRRLKTDGQGMYCMITGGSSNRPTDYNSLAKPASSGNVSRLVSNPSPQQGAGEHSPFIKMRSAGDADGASGGSFAKAAHEPKGTDSLGTGTGGLVEHTHESLEQGGPAFAVYSSD